MRTAQQGIKANRDIYYNRHFITSDPTIKQGEQGVIVGENLVKWDRLGGNFGIMSPDDITVLSGDSLESINKCWRRIAELNEMRQQIRSMRLSIETMLKTINTTEEERSEVWNLYSDCERLKSLADDLFNDVRRTPDAEDQYYRDLD